MSISRKPDKEEKSPQEKSDTGWHDDRENRETWAGKMDFMLSAIGYAVGLGNVWRFPYMCFKYGGGTFLIPYVFFLLLAGVPLFVLEMSMGQFVSLCPSALFQKFCPLFQGLGWGELLVSGFCAIYYNLIISWTIYYIYLSLNSVLPWASCGNWWNSINCVAGIQYLGTNSLNLTSGNLTGQKKTASEEFWENYVLGINSSTGIDDIGTIKWELLLVNLIGWIFIFACLCKGIRTSGRVVYVTATFPYVVLVILLCRGLTLPGAMDGLRFYFIPQWDKLWKLDVWIAGASQIFYSTAVGWGVQFTFGSFNKFHHNILRDATVVPLIACATSIFAGTVVFAILGYMAKEADVDIKDVIASGPGLAFIVYPEVLAKFPLAPVWAVLFFLMILSVGLDSQFGQVESFITAFTDTWPSLRKRKFLFTGFLCLIMFILGLPCTTEGGMYVLQLLDWYVAAVTVMLLGTVECVLMAYNYGVRRFATDIQLMTGRYPSKFFIVSWTVTTPLLVIIIMLSNWIQHTPATYNDYQYPTWALVCGWILALTSLVPVPVYAIINIWRRRHMPFWEIIVDAMRPTPDWGPARLEDRIAYCKSLNQVPSKQLYVEGVENVEFITGPSDTEMMPLENIAVEMDENRIDNEFLYPKLEMS